MVAGRLSVRRDRFTTSARLPNDTSANLCRPGPAATDRSGIMHAHARAIQLRFASLLRNIPPAIMKA
jgi:hypothetical protein